MAILKCIECGGKVSSEAASCPHCGYVRGARPAPEQSATPQPVYTQQPREKSKSNPLLIIGACLGGLVLLILIIIGAAASQSICNVTSLQNREEIFFTNGEADYGIITDAVVSLEGEARQVTVTVRLETNQGDITKSQRIAVSTNGSRQLQIQFTEPTFGAVIKQSYATCK